ncbi:MAG: aspartate/glutamate racemase family protein [Paludibacteraceae bacterium]|nr:aspartate/glutamate racemase family protein [Paludibacteraceae bacterium]
MAKIGVFDSGYGGLTILKEIRKVLPEYDYLYLGDNARAPYGTHSFEVIYQYTLQAVRYLFEQDCALVILACNTASAKALRTIQQKDLHGPNPNPSPKGREPHNVLGVIRPTVEAVPSITKNGHIGILATPATVSSESYVLELEKIQEHKPASLSEGTINASRFSPDKIQRTDRFTITQQACPMWVPLIEAGEHHSAGAKYFVGEYLRQIFEKDPEIDTLVLGCTHYPLLKDEIDKWLAYRHEIEESEFPNPIETPQVTTIAQGELVAHSLADYLVRHPEYREQLSQGGSCHYLTTENADRFSQSASLFIGSPIQAQTIICQEGLFIQEVD